MTDDTTDETESEDVNQYGGGEQEIDAVEQTERVTDEGGDGEEEASEDERGNVERGDDESSTDESSTDESSADEDDAG